MLGQDLAAAVTPTGKTPNSHTVTRHDLADAVYRAIGLSRSDAAEMVNVVLGEISDALVAGETIKLSSFGSFFIRSKAERYGRNPMTRIEARIAPRRVVVFKPSHVLKAKVEG